MAGLGILRDRTAAAAYKNSMSSRTTPTVRAIALVALMGLTLLVLAVLQYRWIGEVSQSERARLRVSLENAVRQFRTEFNAELRRTCLAFEVSPDVLAARRWDTFAARYDEWSSGERHAGLIENLYLLTQREDGEREIRKLDAAAGTWVPAELPQRLEAVRRQAERRAPGRLPPAAATRIAMWRVLPQELALVQPLIVADSRSETPDLVGYLILELNQQYFRDVFLPDMLRRYFSGRAETDFDVAVVGGRDHRKVICALEPESLTNLLDAPDLRSRILWDRSDLPQALAVALSPRQNEGSPALQEPLQAPFPQVRRARRAPVLFGSEAASDWEIVARFRGGSLEEIVAKSRLRSLAVSFGVLLLLGVGMTLIIWGARRSHQLADLQMKFVAGVSHDLRTPLAVICSAADNLAAGVVGDSAQKVREYGALIRNEGRKLSAMVEQILQYASLRSGSRKPDLQPCSVREMVNSVLADEKTHIDPLEIKVETDIPADLPLILCDRSTLQQALRNLVSNSLKHASSGRWLRIRAAAVSDSGRNEVAISVEDRGPGIDPEDLPRVFEPFYRGHNASAAGTPGSGLGLSVVEQSVTAMGGRVTARSTVGIGSTFSVYLPAAGPAAGPPRPINERGCR